MLLERIHKAHVLLLELENIRHKIVVRREVGSNLLTESYEEHLFDQLVRVEILVNGISDILNEKYPNQPPIPRCFKRGLILFITASANVFIDAVSVFI